MNGIRAEVEEIGPAEAARLLSKIHARQTGRDYEKLVARYAHAMTTGEWDQGVAQTISVSQDGELVDGFHRLHAVIKSGKRIRFLVARGVPGEAFRNYDSGKGRSTAFRAGMDKGEAAVANVIWGAAIWPGRNNIPTVGELLETSRFMANPYQNFAATVASTRKPRVGTAQVIAACVLRAKQYPDERDALFTGFASLQAGELRGVSRALGHLYRRLYETRNRPVDVFGLAWLAFDPFRDPELSRLITPDYPALCATLQGSILAPLARALRADSEE